MRPESRSVAAVQCAHGLPLTSPSQLLASAAHRRGLRLPRRFKLVLASGPESFRAAAATVTVTVCNGHRCHLECSSVARFKYDDTLAPVKSSRRTSR